MAPLSFPERHTKVIFLDLEYYVPQADREARGPGGISYSPYKEGHKIIGGVFQTYLSKRAHTYPAKGYWEWKQGSEQRVLAAILRHLEEEWAPLRGTKDACSLVLAGIGITHSDIPVLMARLLHYQLAKPEDLFDLLYGARCIDFSTLAITQYKASSQHLAYPKSKADLYQKCRGGTVMDSSTSVWDLYDARQFGSIERRCRTEVDDCLMVYKAIMDLAAEQHEALKKYKRHMKQCAKGGSEDSSDTAPHADHLGG